MVSANAWEKLPGTKLSADIPKEPSAAIAPCVCLVFATAAAALVAPPLRAVAVVLLVVDVVAYENVCAVVFVEGARLPGCLRLFFFAYGLVTGGGLLLLVLPPPTRLLLLLLLVFMLEFPDLRIQ